MTAPNLETITAESLDQIMTWLKAGVETGGQFVAEQAPLVAWEIVTFGRATSSFSMLTNLAAVGLGLWFFRLLKNNVECAAEMGQGSDAAFAKCMLGGIVGGILTIGGVINLSYVSRDFFLAWFAPRLYIIEYLSNLL